MPFGAPYPSRSGARQTPARSARRPCGRPGRRTRRSRRRRRAGGPRGPRRNRRSARPLLPCGPARRSQAGRGRAVRVALVEGPQVGRERAAVLAVGQRRPGAARAGRPRSPRGCRARAARPGSQSRPRGRTWRPPSRSVIATVKPASGRPPRRGSLASRAARPRPAMVCSRTAQSATERAIGPAWSKLVATGMIPSSGTRPTRRLDRADAAERRREAQRAAGVGAGRGRDHARGERRRRSAARAAGGAVQVPRVADLVGRRPGAELVRVGVAEQAPCPRRAGAARPRCSPRRDVIRRARGSTPSAGAPRDRSRGP